MPELPEVETIKRQLAEHLAGKEIAEVEVLNEKSWSDSAKLNLTGMEVAGVRRRGKALIIDLEVHRTKGERTGLSRKVSLVIHLKMTGQLIYETHGPGNLQHLQYRLVGGHPTEDFVNKLPSKHTRVTIKFKVQNDKETKEQASRKLKLGTGNSQLFFNDQRKFGWIKVMPTEEVEKLKFIEDLGKEPWEFTATEWIKVLNASKKPIKVRLMDQNAIAGVGNIYANDACWEAKVDPRRAANSLNEKEMVLLLEKVRLVLDEGIKYGGATASNYVNLHGMGGKYQEHFRVYQQVGEECLRRDGGVVRKATIGGRGTYWCEVCQR